MLSFFPRGVLDEILNLIESVSEGCPSYSWCKRKGLRSFCSETAYADASPAPPLPRTICLQA